MFEASENHLITSPAVTPFIRSNSAPGEANVASIETSWRCRSAAFISGGLASAGFAPFVGPYPSAHVDAVWRGLSKSSSARVRTDAPRTDASRLAGAPLLTGAPRSMGSRFPEVHVTWLHAHSIGERLAALAVARPHSSVMSELARIDPTTLRGEDAITWLQAHERLTSWWASLQAPAIVRAAGAGRYETRVVAGVDILGESAAGHVTISDAVREELAAALRLSPATAQARIDSARLLCGPLSATHTAQSEGRITPSHVSIIVSAAARLRGVWDDDEAARTAFHDSCDLLQRRVLPVAMRSTLALTRRAAKHAVIAVDPIDAQHRRLQSLTTRDVFVIDELDGVSTLIARMATEHAHACLSVINDRAKQCEWSDSRSTNSTNSTRSVPISAGERRSLALAALLLDGVPQEHSRDTAGATRLLPRLRADINLVIDLPTLLALRDGSAELVGAGDIPAEVVRELLDHATLRRIITDPTTGELLDYGRRTYVVPQRLREFIVARDRTCRFPGCGTAAARSQIDHAIPWSRGGETNRDNLGALCVRHHQLKTHGGWRIVQSDAHGGCTWQSPQGRQYEHVTTPILASIPMSLSPCQAEIVSRLDPGEEHLPAVARDGPISE